MNAVAQAWREVFEVGWVPPDPPPGFRPWHVLSVFTCEGSPAGVDRMVRVFQMRCRYGEG